MGTLEPTAVGTMARALRQAASERGHTLSDTLCALMIGQLVGSEGCMPGFVGSGATLAGTNNMGAAQVAKGFPANHAKPGWGAFAHKDSDPNQGAYLGWYWVAPSPLEAARYWLSNWWGGQLLSQNPSDATSYATILYRGRYFGGMTPGDPSHDPTSDAGQANIKAYAAGIARATPSAAALNGPSNDPATVTVDASKFATLAQRGITEALFTKANGGGLGSAWKGILGSSWPASFSDLDNANGVVWFAGPPAGSGGGWTPPLDWGAGLLLSALAGFFFAGVSAVMAKP